MDQHEFQQIIANIKNSKKYRSLDLPDEMLQDLLQIEAVKNIPTRRLSKPFAKSFTMSWLPTWKTSITLKSQKNSLLLLIKNPMEMRSKPGQAAS